MRKTPSTVPMMPVARPQPAASLPCRPGERAISRRARTASTIAGIEKMMGSTARPSRPRSSEPRAACERAPPRTSVLHFGQTSVPAASGSLQHVQSSTGALLPGGHCRLAAARSGMPRACPFEVRRDDGAGGHVEVGAAAHDLLQARLDEADEHVLEPLERALAPQ